MRAIVWMVASLGWANVSAAEEPAPPPPTHVKLGVDGGLTTASDARASGWVAGFSVTRAPDLRLMAQDPFEFSVTGSWRRATSKGELTNDQLLGGVRVDLNRIAGPVTVFLFATAERNPIANRALDLLVAPLGVKYDLVISGPFTSDIGFAPVWNYRSTIVPDGGTCTGDVAGNGSRCTFSKLRGSLRWKASYGRDSWRINEQLFFLPTLVPSSGNLFAAVSSEGILRSDTKLTVKLGKNFELVETMTFVRDPLLKAQANCVEEPENWLCNGITLQTGMTLGLSVAF